MSATRVLGDRYRLRERSATGRGVETWRAHDERLDRDVIVHLVSGSPNEAELRQWRAVFDRWSRTSHPRLGQLLDSGHDDGRPFAVRAILADADAGAADGELALERLASDLGVRLGHDQRRDPTERVVPPERFAASERLPRPFVEVSDRLRPLAPLRTYAVLGGILLALLFVALSFGPPSAARASPAPAVATAAPAAAPPAPVTPDVRGKGLHEASSALLGAGYGRVRWSVDRDASGPACTVVRQEPAPGAPVQRGAEAVVHLANGRCG